MSRYDAVLTPPAREFVTLLVRRFAPRIAALLQERQRRWQALDSGQGLDFLPETRAVRESEWSVAPLPADLLDRRVEITGPVDAKMIINALNSGAQVFMADFEDSTAPTWDNLMSGQANLMGAVRRTLRFVAAETGKEYALRERTAVLMVRPRGLHLPERHFVVDGQPAPGSLVDFGLYFFHNCRELLQRGTGPYFYLPKLESHLEARLWNEVFLAAQAALGVPPGTIKATCLIETLPAAFEMDEILYELRQHSAGLNCGRWDYIFSFIKKRRLDPHAVLPDRAQVTMDKGFLRAYAQLLIKTCHRRGVHAMGGMAAQIPIKDNPEKNAEALARVRADKLREVGDGHDGTWVAHPGLCPVASAVFTEHLTGPNQLHKKREDVQVTRDDLLAVPAGTITEGGLRHNIRVGVQYVDAWLRGVGCVPLYNLMEDAATAEICRAQLWQWLRHGANVVGLGPLHADRLRAVIAEEVAQLGSGVSPRAVELFSGLVFSPDFVEFLTVPAYEWLARQDETLPKE